MITSLGEDRVGGASLYFEKAFPARHHLFDLSEFTTTKGIGRGSIQHHRGGAQRSVAVLVPRALGITEDFLSLGPIVLVHAALVRCPLEYVLCRPDHLLEVV